MKTFITTSLFAFALLASPVIAAENATIEGVWNITSMKIKGKERSRRADSMFTVSDGKYTVQVGTAVIHGTYKTDDSQTPKHIDLIPKDDQGRDRPALGIYKIEGDTLTICTRPFRDGKAGPRATDFDSKQYTLMTYKRKK